MAKKLRILYDSTLSTGIVKKNKKTIKQKSKEIIIFFLLMLIVVLSAWLVIGIFYYKGELSTLKKNIKNLEEEKKLLKKEINSLEKENEKIHNNLFSVIGADSVHYVNNKLDFYDKYVVFQIKGYGNYYYTYDCMMKKVGSTEFSFWVYSENAAIARGLREGGC